MKIIGKTLYGLEKVLADELAAFGAADVIQLNRAVSFSGGKDLLYRVNYACRTALSFLVPVSEFRIRSRDDLYRGASGIEWDRYLGTDSTFSVVPVVKSNLFSHSGFPALVLKDAVADYFRKKSGRRPSVDVSSPGLLINLHISNDKVTVSLDSSAEPLYRRGYRLSALEAPINEVLAAGLLGIAGWKGQSPLLDPMCGSGTIPAEAAMIASRTPAGIRRESFGFEKWKDFDRDMFLRIKSEENAGIVTPSVAIEGRDISAEAVDIARENSGRAGVDAWIDFTVSNFSESGQVQPGTTIIMNPPYGERIGKESPDLLYGMIGSTLKHRCTGSEAWIITSNPDSLKFIGLRPAAKHTVFNGALECRLLKYALYQGSVKKGGS